MLVNSWLILQSDVGKPLVTVHAGVRTRGCLQDAMPRVHEGGKGALG